MKKLIKQATDYSNLSQWIQMEVWKYIEETKVMEYRHSRGVELADRIIKRVLADKNLVNNKIHKEVFNAGYKKALKDVIKCIERNEGSSRPKADVLKWINRELLK